MIQGVIGINIKFSAVPPTARQQGPMRQQTLNYQVQIDFFWTGKKVSDSLRPLHFGPTATLETPTPGDDSAVRKHRKRETLTCRTLQ